MDSRPPAATPEEASAPRGGREAVVNHVGMRALCDACDGTAPAVAATASAAADATPAGDKAGGAAGASSMCAVDFFLALAPKVLYSN